MRAVHIKSQASSLCCGTRVWLNRIDLAGSIPLAINAAVSSRTLERSVAASPFTVIACRSARKNRQLPGWAFCMATH